MNPKSTVAAAPAGRFWPELDAVPWHPATARGPLVWRCRFPASKMSVRPDCIPAEFAGSDWARWPPVKNSATRRALFPRRQVPSTRENGPCPPVVPAWVWATAPADQKDWTRWNLFFGSRRRRFGFALSKNTPGFFVSSGTEPPSVCANRLLASDGWRGSASAASARQCEASG